MTTSDKEKRIASRYYWDVGHIVGVGYFEEHYQAGIAPTLTQLKKALAIEQRGLKHYYSMSPKARRFGLWASQGKRYREKIKILKELIKER